MTGNVSIRKIIKRDGRTVPFDPEKITDAIFQAVHAGGSNDRGIAEETCRQVVDILSITYKGNRIPTVEEVQDLVEYQLIESGHAEIAKRYILYRHQHEEIRTTKKLLDDAVKMIDDYLHMKDWRINENSNMSYSLQGLNNHIASSISSHYWLSKIYPKEIRELHEGGDFHLHDLGLLSVYCCGWDLKDLLIQGFKGAFGKVESSPARHFRSILGQIVNFFYTMQGESAGAQAFANFDTLLAPFIAFDKLTYKQVKQSMQEFIFNMNIPTRVGFQTPFTNITMDLVCPRYYADEAVIIGGKMHESATYKEFQEEMDMINRAYCEVMMEGDALDRIFTFPIPTYNITKDFNWDNRNLDLLWEMTARYGVPYFSNFINSDMDPEDARSMCCRLRLDNRQLRDLGKEFAPAADGKLDQESLTKRGGGLFGANPLTGSIGVVTLNMPRIGYESKSRAEWFNRIDYLMDRAKESLELKRKVLERFTENGLYPYSKYYLNGVKERKRHDGRDSGYWDNHFSTIGLIGMNEGLVNFMGKDITSHEGVELAKETLNHMNRRLMEFQKQTRNFYNLEATPGEGTTYRLAKADRKKYPEIFAQGQEDPYYTNSTHLPVEYTDDLFLALQHQDPLQTLYTGGTVLHGFVGERIDDVEACKMLVRRIAENFKMPYYTISPTFTICPEHGYIAGEHLECPY